MAALQHLSGVPAGFEAFALKKLASFHRQIVFVAAHAKQAAQVAESLCLIAPRLSVLPFPAWDTVPYDRVAPQAQITGRRIDTLSLLTENPAEPFVVLTTVRAMLQRVPPPSFFAGATLRLRAGQDCPFESLTRFLSRNGYRAADTVLESGEYAVRGGLIDLFPAGAESPVRVDFMGDAIETLRAFDPLTQRSSSSLAELRLRPIREFALDAESVSRFRTGYRALFDAASQDAFYEAVSAGRYMQGLEHFLPLFHAGLSFLGDYLPQAAWALDFRFDEALRASLEQIREYYDARAHALTQAYGKGGYFPIPPETFFMTQEQLEQSFPSGASFRLTPFQEPGAADMGGRAGSTFAQARVSGRHDVFEAVAELIRAEQRAVVLTASSEGSCRRLASLLRERDVFLQPASSFAEAVKKKRSFLTAPFESGFATDDWLVITETDILGERMQRAASHPNRPARIATDIETFHAGDLLVHEQHGIGRFLGLVSLDLGGALHDCLSLEYDRGDKLFVPVENADVVSRYGESETAALDRLGSPQFAARKERVKKDLLALAGRLMEVASARLLDTTEQVSPTSSYQAFCAGFPYAETEDQLRTIQEIEQDLAQGVPMDRLVCGDVGFGKTEVAMRAAFLMAQAGYQVAVAVPTTLLARQHAANFQERFRDFPIRIDSLSRLTGAAAAKKIKHELAQGSLDIVIGTHALFSPSVRFKRLGMVVVDEEQHFGVLHKERLKELKKGVHVLTLTATPIPRTLQLSLSGVRSLSLIATPPVDRLAVKTYITPFDAVIVKEALLREHFRGGQTFFVCPRIADMNEIHRFLAQTVPDIRVVEAHGRMSAARLEEVMTAFSEKKYDILLATSIVESGLDMPSVNTLIIHRADMFGLSALYQLRGRVGRGKLRAYAYLTTPADFRISETAQKRLTVMQGLDSLGAGFALASHDLDIRGAGNLLGEEQSGQIREVGVALYQKMLREAVQALGARSGEAAQESYSPQIITGLPVSIPESYIPDLDVRMEIYHRAGALEDIAGLDSLRAELWDRFGQYPGEVENLLATVELKILSKAAHIERLEAGATGAHMRFHRNTFPNPAGLVACVAAHGGSMRLRPDGRLIVLGNWPELPARLAEIRKIILKLTALAQTA